MQAAQRDYSETDVTIETFNYCSGSCTGCLLSVAERADFTPTLSAEDFALACQRLEEYSQACGLKFRLVMAFGDVILLPLQTQQRYFEAAQRHGLRLGATMTLTEPREAHYAQAIAALKAADPTAVFDITLDPFRALNFADYTARVRHAIAQAPHLHVQVLLSEAVMAKLSPRELNEAVLATTEGRPALLGFAPSLSNLGIKNYKYDVQSAAEYALRYYEASAVTERLLQEDMARFEARGSYGDFLRQTFHIGAGLNLYPVAYTIFGDVIFDQRNNARPLGNLRQQSIAATLMDVRLRTMDALNAAQMQADRQFGCAACEHQAACTFNGVGMARRIYSDFEAKTGACYGPRGIWQPRASSARRHIPISAP